MLLLKAIRYRVVGRTGRKLPRDVHCEACGDSYCFACREPPHAPALCTMARAICCCSYSESNTNTWDPTVIGLSACFLVVVVIGKPVL